MSSEELVKLIDHMLFYDDNNTIALGDIVFFQSFLCSNTDDGNDYYTVIVNRKALSNILEGKNATTICCKS